MENHKKILGIIYIVSALMQALTLFVISILMSTIVALVLDEANPKDARFIELILSIFQYLPIIVVATLILPSLIAGIGLLTKQSWGLTIALIAGCFKLLSFPIGTAIGIYTFWVYNEDKKTVSHD